MRRLFRADTQNRPHFLYLPGRLPSSLPPFRSQFLLRKDRLKENTTSSLKLHDNDNSRSNTSQRWTVRLHLNSSVKMFNSLQVKISEILIRDREKQSEIYLYLRFSWRQEALGRGIFLKRTWNVPLKTGSKVLQITADMECRYSRYRVEICRYRHWISWK